MHGRLLVLDQEVTDGAARLGDRLAELDVAVAEDAEDVAHPLVDQVAHHGLAPRHAYGARRGRGRFGLGQEFFFHDVLLAGDLASSVQACSGSKVNPL